MQRCLKSLPELRRSLPSNAASRLQTGWRQPCLLLICLAMAGCGRSKPVDTLAAATEALEYGRYAEATELVKDIPETDDRWQQCQFILGRAAFGMGDAREALEIWKRVPRDGTELAISIAKARSELFLINCKYEEGIDELRYLSSLNNNQFEVSERLVGLLNATGLTSQARPYLLQILSSYRIKIPDLVSLMEPERPYGNVTNFPKCSSSLSDDPYVWMFQAKSALSRNDPAAAQAGLKRVVAKCPDWADAHALLGELLLNSDSIAFQQWCRDLPEGVKDSAGVQYVQGLWARKMEAPQVAARCFWKAVQDAPHDRRSMFQLGQVLTSLNHMNADLCVQRCNDLKRCIEVMERVLISQGQQAESFAELISLLNDIGRKQEAEAWSNLAKDRFGPSAWIDRAEKGANEAGTGDSTHKLASINIAALFDLADWPGIDTLLERSASTPKLALDAAGISFTDSAVDAGIDFTYYQSADPLARDVRIFESTGGGVGIVDFDGDLQPDIFLTQGEPWAKGQSVPAAVEKYYDVLYRNRSAQQGFAVADAAMLKDDGYGQGCSVGDFNDDGFPDIYVACIGANKLLINNGDGTFDDVAQQCGLTEAAWTSSCLILDLNGDGNPDIYDVNYLSGENVFKVECGRNRCSVRDFSGAEDHVWLSQADGTFRRVVDAAPKDLAKGLGIVAMFSNGDPRPVLFIANDQVPNFLLHPVVDSDVYQDIAAERGLAVNMLGDPTAAMGVAAADLDGNRHLDLFVTNFEGEANCLYLQQEGGFFQDAVATAGLRSSGLQYVGWGTQFLDAANRGVLDIVVANGHVADFRDDNGQYKMPLQFFDGSHRTHFQQLNPKQLGEPFQRNALGRSLATVDWNQDGRTDFVVSNIASPTMLVSNTTKEYGHWLDVQLHARQTARDACGATVEAEISGNVVWKQVSAGDGYQASNQRRLHFGFGDTANVEKLTIRWPSGATSILTNIAADGVLIAVEGSISATYQTSATITSVPVENDVPQVSLKDQ